MLGKDYQGQDCSLAKALEVIGERWTLLILRDAFFGVARFNDFRDHLDIPKAILSTRLASLVDHGVLERRADPGHSGRHRYGLTQAGRELWPAVYALLVWGGRHRWPNSRTFIHAACGSTLDERGACPACGLVPGPEELVTEPVRPSPRTDPVSLALGAPHRLLEPLVTNAPEPAPTPRPTRRPPTLRRGRPPERRGAGRRAAGEPR